MVSRVPDDVTLGTLHEDLAGLQAEGNRLGEERFAHLDVRIREQHLEVQQVLHAVVEGQRFRLSGDIKAMAGEVRALIARLDALIRGRGDGEPAP